MPTISISQLLTLTFSSSDPHGHIRLDDFEFTRYLRDELRRRTDELGLDLRFTDKKVGYELRCADPVAFDIMYTRDLGCHAVSYLASGGHGGMVVGEQVMTFDELKDPVTGKTRVRLVDVHSNNYQVARKVSLLHYFFFPSMSPDLTIGMYYILV